MKKLIALPILCILVLPLLVSASHVPRPSDYQRVYDWAGILENDLSLEADILGFERNSTIEIVIATIDALPPDHTIQSFALGILEEWGVGLKEEDNGIVVLIVKDGGTRGRLRIELGYGIQGYITGAESGRILDKALPYYTSGDYSQAAAVILEGLKDQLKNYQPGKPAHTNGNWVLPGIFFLVFILLLIFFITLNSKGFKLKCEKCGVSSPKRFKTSIKSSYAICKKCGNKIKSRRKQVNSIVGYLVVVSLVLLMVSVILYDASLVIGLFAEGAGFFIIFLIFAVVGVLGGRTKCPECGSKDLRTEGDYHICKNCGKKFKKKRSSQFFVAGGYAGGGGFGGGGGGFGGGGGGGGGASR